MEIRPLYI